MRPSVCENKNNTNDEEQQVDLEKINKKNRLCNQDKLSKDKIKKKSMRGRDT